VSLFKFKTSQRIAIWRAWDKSCYLCETPVRYFDLDIDHVVPESLLKKPAELQKLRDDLGIDAAIPNFQINHFCNWAPVHRRPCNGTKTDYHAPITLFILKKVQTKLERVYEILETIKREEIEDKILSKLHLDIERGNVSLDAIQELVDQQREQAPIEDPIVLAFGLSIHELYQNPEFATGRILGYPALCDWLEADLQHHLAKIMKTECEYSEPSHRDGENLTVRIVFPGLKEGDLRNFSRSWWHVLEQSTFRTLYQTSYRQEYPPAKRVTLLSPVKVTLHEGETANFDEDDMRKYAKFWVIGYEFFDDTKKARFLAEQMQRGEHWRRRLTHEQIEEQHVAVPGGIVTIETGDGEEETMDLFNEYLAMVGLDGELADGNPVDWLPYADELRTWYEHASEQAESDQTDEYDDEEEEDFEDDED
jgi:hypothetical protein